MLSYSRLHKCLRAARLDDDLSGWNSSLTRYTPEDAILETGGARVEISGCVIFRGGKMA